MGKSYKYLTITQIQHLKGLCRHEADLNPMDASTQTLTSTGVDVFTLTEGTKK